jgi:hypothetical protein
LTFPVTTIFTVLPKSEAGTKQVTALGETNVIFEEMVLEP